ncbi:hypothetical protein BC826DRAFT_1045713 [Russula brevipes]|nr:hypothetical protein BC826DRAFT_1045713 [Russula brevipes]
MHPGAMHGRPPKPPGLCTQSPMAWAPNRADLKPEGRALFRRGRSIFDGDEGAHSDSWPQPATNIESGPLLEGEQKKLTSNVQRAGCCPTDRRSRTAPSKSVCRRRSASASDGRWRTPRAQ